MSLHLSKKIPNYHIANPNEVSKSYLKDLEMVMKKYDQPQNFDKLTSTEYKIDMTNQKMKENLHMALENTEQLNVIII